MASSTTREREAVLGQITALLGEHTSGLTGPEDPPVAVRLLEHVATEDLAERDAAVYAGLVSASVKLARTRGENETLVSIYNPDSARDGWTTPHTIVQVCTDDMPFLVDSVSAAISGAGHLVDLIVHPQIAVRRGANGNLEQVRPERPPTAAGTVESWMTFAVERMSEHSREELTAQLTKVLNDVRIAVEDWIAMRSQCEELARDLTNGTPATVDPSEAEPTERFLRWLAQDHFTFLGYREYLLDVVDGHDVLRPVPGTGLGILRNSPETPDTYATLRPEASQTARDPHLLTVTKANSRATVHRAVYLDYIGIRSFDADGNVIGEKRFLGMFTTAAYAESVLRLPIVSEKVQAVLARSGFSAHSHSGKDLLGILEDYPRDELFQADVDTLTRVVDDVAHLAQRRRSKMYVRKDEFGRFVSVLVYLPRDRYNTTVRLRVEEILRHAIGSDQVDYTTRVNESALARMHFVLRLPRDASAPDIDLDSLQDQLAAATHTWEEDLLDALHGHPEEEAAIAYVRGFPEAYKEDFDAASALEDLRYLKDLGASDTRVRLYQPRTQDSAARRMKVYRGASLTLTDLLPLFTDLGVEVLDERPYRLKAEDGSTRYVYDFGLRLSGGADWPDASAADGERFEEAFAAVRDGRAESDGLGALVLAAGLGWREVVVLRTIARYLRQIGSTFSVEYLEAALVAHPEISRMIVRLFEARFRPSDEAEDSEARAAAAGEVRSAIYAALDEVSSLDHDRIIRSFVGVIDASMRTNYFQHDSSGNFHAHVSLKLECAKVPGIPAPVPMAEIWVYSPRVEGVHLRFGAVARGGLRWSDRREDFRTEVLGLVKAQMVKNAVIVPTGSKGGFFAKQLPDPSVDRPAWIEEGKRAYVEFIRGMLDLTDNRVSGEVVPPAEVVRHDGDDPYLVVAADKGTASFSDLANSISADYSYWLDDAFASGGSAGYDHKEMGITARGAWESTKRHFRELGRDTQTEDFTVVGIGDMSGDVFGNGMLLSRHIRLVAAFDHRHVFVDPTPDAESSFAERERLFELSRSSWGDYDESLISAGGGVFPRSAKSITITDQMRQALGIDDGVAHLSPAELIHACLKAPVDLVYNGGIGTYIKASSESNSDIGDRANDAIRVNGCDLRALVVVEGGNLGASQLGRIEAAQAGIKINTDAIDNSAGVGSSDREVNLKILFTSLIKEGRLDLAERNKLLASMTDEVAALVLRDNYVQNVLLGNSRAQAHAMLGVHQRLIHWLEERGELNRALEFLPTDAQIAKRDELGEGLTQPEFAVLVAYAKLALKADLIDSSLPEGPWFHTTLKQYFPRVLREQFETEIEQHPLRREIIVNAVVNAMVNRGGITFAYRAAQETGANSEQVARAFVASARIFEMDTFTDAVQALDAQVDTAHQADLYLDFRRLLDRTSRWFVTHRPEGVNVADEVDKFSEPISQLADKLPSLLAGAEAERYQERKASLEAEGVPADLAHRAAALIPLLGLLDVVELAGRGGESLESLAALYFAASDRFSIDSLLIKVADLPRDDRWDALARASLRNDLYTTLADLVASIASDTDANAEPGERLASWESRRQAQLARVTGVLPRVVEQGQGLAAASVAVRTLAGLAR